MMTDASRYGLAGFGGSIRLPARFFLPPPFFFACSRRNAGKVRLRLLVINA